MVSAYAGADAEGPAYSYDALGRLAERTDEAGQEESFVYAGLDNNPIAVLDAAGEPSSGYGRDAGGDLLSVTEDGQGPGLAYTNTHDDLAAVIDPEGLEVAAAAAYTPFGEVTDTSGAEQSLGYQGEWTDPATGDVNMHARWYQPGTGRFASRDTMTLEPDPSVQGNRYTYGNADPVGHVDPSGHFSCWHGFGLGCGSNGGGGNAGGGNKKGDRLEENHREEGPGEGAGLPRAPPAGGRVRVREAPGGRRGCPGRGSAGAEAAAMAAEVAPAGAVAPVAAAHLPRLGWIPAGRSWTRS